MDLSNVYDYYGEHSVVFSDGVTTKHTWNDWGLVPSSRHSEPVNGIWSHTVTINGVNGQEDLVRLAPFTSVNSHENLKEAVKNDNRSYIKTTYGYDIFMPMSGSLSFIIADQNTSFFAKQQEILNFLHNQSLNMQFTDDPAKTYTVRTTVEGFNSAAKYGTITIKYSVISET